MTCNPDFFQTIGGSARANTNVLTDATSPRAPQVHSYLTTDSQATIDEPGYFNSVRQFLQVGDTIDITMISATNGLVSSSNYKVSSKSLSSVDVTVSSSNVRNNVASAKYMNIETKRQAGSGITPFNFVNTHKDFRVIGTAEQDWDAVRLIILNYETIMSVQGFTANFAPTANMTTPNVPTGSWTTFTWSGAGSINLAAATAGTGASAKPIPSINVSDWMSSANIQSVARDDGGTYPMWMITQHNPIGSGTAVTFTNGSANITWTSHGKSIGEMVFLTTTGTLPTNFVASTRYYIVSTPDADTITISATSGGGAITAGSAGSGTHTGFRAAAYTFEAQSSTAFDTDLLLSGRRFYKMFQGSVDGVTTPTNFTTTTESNNCNPFIIQFRSRGRVLSFMCSGDSIPGGSGTTSNMLSPGLLAQIGLSSSTFPVQYIGAGYAGRCTVDSLAEAKAIISAVNPQVCFYSPYSPNDGTLTSTIVNTQLRQATDFIQHCRANDCIPVLWTPTPDNTDSLTVSNLKISMTNTLLSWRAKGIQVADIWGAVAAFPGANSSTGWGWITGYNNADGIHENDTGATVMKTPITSVLQSVLAASS